VEKGTQRAAPALEAESKIKYGTSDDYLVVFFVICKYCTVSFSLFLIKVSVMLNNITHCLGSLY
jgi:hypothetical protein